MKNYCLFKITKYFPWINRPLWYVPQKVYVKFPPTHTIESYLLCHQVKPMILIDPSGKCHIMQRTYMSQNNKLSKITFKKLRQWYLDYISVDTILKNTLKKAWFNDHFFWLIKTTDAFLWVSLMVNINMMKNGGKVKIKR